MPKKFLVVCLNPVIQKTLVFERLELDSVNRAPRRPDRRLGQGSECGARAFAARRRGGPLYPRRRAQPRLVFIPLRRRRACRGMGRFGFRGPLLLDHHRCRGYKQQPNLSKKPFPFHPARPNSFSKRFESLVSRFDVLIVSGTKAAGYPDSVIPAMVKRASAQGLMTLLDIKGRDLVACLPFRPAVVKPNLSEFLATFPAPGGASAGAAALLRPMCRITRKHGRNGMEPNSS